MAGLVLSKPQDTNVPVAIGGFFGNNIGEFIANRILGLQDAPSLAGPKLALRIATPFLILVVQSKFIEATSDGSPSTTARSYIQGAKIGAVTATVGNAITLAIAANKNELAVQAPKVKGSLINPPSKPLPTKAGSFQGVARPRI